MSKGILKRQESIESTCKRKDCESTPESASKHVKWDEEKLKESDSIKMTIPKGQINEPKTPFQQGIYGSSCDESGDDVFKLRDEEGGSVTGHSENEISFSLASSSNCGWESSMSEFETDADAEIKGEEEQKEKVKHEKFKSMRAQHYFMRQSLQRGKELIETDDDDD